MEKQVYEFLNSTDAAVLVSAGAAAISAVCALLTFLFSRRKSRREMVDVLKVEILQVVASVQGRIVWIETVRFSAYHEGGGIGANTQSLAKLLPRKYRRKSWLWLIPVAIEELKRENYSNLLGL